MGQTKWARTLETGSNDALQTNNEPVGAHLSRLVGCRTVRWFTRGLAFLVCVGGGALGPLLFATPSASTATALLRAQAAAHGITYPGASPPRRFTKALIATEDQPFYSPFDPGIHPLAIIRVSIHEITGQLGDPGGNTIAQQLAKMLYTPGRDGPVAKLEQVILAIKLDFTYSKAKILPMYAEVVYFGGGYYGLGAASCGYFGARPADLNWEQAATLVGVINAPSADEPRTHPQAARSGEVHVFKKLMTVGDLSRSRAQAVFAEPLALERTGGCNQPHSVGGHEAETDLLEESDQPARVDEQYLRLLSVGSVSRSPDSRNRRTGKAMRNFHTLQSIAAWRSLT